MVNQHKKDIENFYLEKSRSEKNLMMTKCFSEIWWTMIQYNKGMEMLDKFEDLISCQCIKEWGVGTIAYFDRNKKIINIENFNKNKKTIIDFNGGNNNAGV